MTDAGAAPAHPVVRGRIRDGAPPGGRPGSSAARRPPRRRAGPSAGESAIRGESVVRAMLSGAPRTLSRTNPVRRALPAVAIVAVLLLGGLGALSGAGAIAPAGGAGSTGSHAAAPRAAGGVAPTIFFFYASPSELFVGSTTYFDVDAFGTGALSYSYGNLPGGCVTSDTPFLGCTPSVAGFFNVSVTVSQSGTPSAVAYTTLSVDAALVGNFFSYNSTVATWSNGSAEDCQAVASPPFYQEFCDPEVQAPSLLPFANGSVGVAYQQETTVTANPCSPAGATVARVEFQTSVDNGSTFGNATDLGNDTCAFLNAIEPSFASSGNSVYGAFIEENSSLAPWNYVTRSVDGIGFVSSTNAGLTFSTPVSLDLAGNLARPSVAAVGSTIYIAFEDIRNETGTIAGGVHPISVKLIVSKDGGLHWSTPKTLAGLNASQDYTAASPAVAVSPTGAVSVAYATGRSCVSAVGATCLEYADSIVVATSTDNGTTFSSPAVVGSRAGETACFSGACEPGDGEATTEISLAYAPGSSDLYVAWAATYDQGLAGSANYNHSGIFAAASVDGGSSWSGGPVDAPLSTGQRYFEPGLGATAGTVYLTFLEANETPGEFGFANSLSNFVQTIDVGATSGWTVPTATDIESFTSGGSVNNTRSSFAGYGSSVAVTASGRPLIAFSLPEPLATSIAQSPSYYYANTTTPAALVVGALVLPTDPDALAIAFEQTGIPVGDEWQFQINGLFYLVPTPTIEFLNVPAGVPMMTGAAYLGGYWTIVASYFNASLSAFYFNETDTFAFSIWVGLEFNTFPPPNGPAWNVDPYPEWLISPEIYSSPISTYVYGQWELGGDEICILVCTTTLYNDIYYYSPVDFWSNYCSPQLCNWTAPWYFPLGATISLQITSWNYYGLTPTYWTGQGSGAYTGEMQGQCYDPYFGCDLYTGTIDMNGPINETLWLADAPENLSANLTVAASGLPSTAVYHFDLNDVPYTANASEAVTVPSVPAGTYAVTSVWASSVRHGWKYFGTVNDPNPFVSPLITSINLTFPAFVNVSAPIGNVTFEAPALLPGTAWSLTFNGTTYTSTSEWINVTTRPGTYPWSVGDAAAPSGTAGYVPKSVAAEVSVVTGHTYDVAFTPAYLVRVLSSPGGLVSVGGGGPQVATSDWVTDGETVPIVATLASGYAFVGWSGTGAGAYNGTELTSSVTANSPIVENAAFQPLPGARFNLTVIASGLPSDLAPWTVQVGNSSYTSNLTEMTVGNLWSWTAPYGLGAYKFAVPDAYETGTNLTRYVPGPVPRVVGTNGSFTPAVVVPFSPQSLFQLDALNGGIVESTVAGAPEGTSDWVAPGTNVTISADANPGFTFVGWVGSGPGAYTGANASQVVRAWGPVTEVASFAVVVTPPTPRYTITFELASPTAVATGTVWTVVVGGTGYSSDGTEINVTGELAGTYPVAIGTATAPGGLIEYRPTAGDPAAYTVRGNATLTVAFTTYYWVAIEGSVGGTVSPSNAYYEANSVLYLVATPDAGDAFAGWTGSGGAGNYTGSNATASILVTSPLTEVAQFRGSTSVAAASSIWANPDAWLGVGAVALLVGLVVGVVAARFRSAPTRARSTAPPSAAPPGRGSP
jgi:Divergent InlB B-repeat domain